MPQLNNVFARTVRVSNLWSPNRGRQCEQMTIARKRVERIFARYQSCELDARLDNGYLAVATIETIGIKGR